MKRNLSPRLKRRPTARYLTLLLCLSFLVGQVPYAYATYYCTVEHKAVGMPSKEERSSPKDLSTKICDACQGVLIIHRTEGVAKPNCLRVEKHKKDVTDSFAENGYATPHPLVCVVLIGCKQAGRSDGKRALLAFPRNASPPENIPLLGSSLRI